MADYSIVQEAIRRGYSMDEIADKLSAVAGHDPAQIRERGYDSGEILSRLGYVEPPKEEPKNEGFLSGVKDTFSKAADIYSDPNGGALPALGKVMLDALPNRTNQDKESSFGSVAKDIYGSALTGTLNIGPAALGFLDWASAGSLDKATHAVTGESMTERFGRAKQAENYGVEGTDSKGALSSQLQQQQGELNNIMNDENGGLLPAVGYVMSNPRLASSMIADTLGISMGAGAVTNLAEKFAVGALTKAAAGGTISPISRALVPMIDTAADLRGAGMSPSEITSVLMKGTEKLPGAIEVFGERANIAVNFAMEAGDTANSTMSDVMGRSAEELNKTSSTFRAYKAQGLSDDDAKFKTAQDTKFLAGLVGGAVGGIATKISGAGAFEAKLFGKEGTVGGIEKGGKELLKTIGKEGTEEFIQGFGDQFGQDVGTTAYVDKSNPIISGKTWAQAGVGGLVGAAFGGGAHMVGSTINPAQTKETPSPQSSDVHPPAPPSAGTLPGGSGQRADGWTYNGRTAEWEAPSHTTPDAATMQATDADSAIAAAAAATDTASVTNDVQGLINTLPQQTQESVNVPQAAETIQSQAQPEAQAVPAGAVTNAQPEGQIETTQQQAVQTDHAAIAPGVQPAAKVGADVASTPNLAATIKPLADKLAITKAPDEQPAKIIYNSAKVAAVNIARGKTEPNAKVFKTHADNLAKMFDGKYAAEAAHIMAVHDAIIAAQPAVTVAPTLQAKAEKKLKVEATPEDARIREEAKSLGIANHAFGKIDTLAKAIANKKIASAKSAYEVVQARANELIDSNAMADIEEAALKQYGAHDASELSFKQHTDALEQAITDHKPKEVKDEGTQGNAGATATGTTKEDHPQHGAETGDEVAAQAAPVVQPAKQSHAIPESDIPKSLQITLEREVGGKTKKPLVNARKAMLAANRDVERYEALKGCLG